MSNAVITNTNTESETNYFIECLIATDFNDPEERLASVNKDAEEIMCLLDRMFNGENIEC